MKTLDALIGRISSALNKIGGLIILPIMTAMMTADVILRYGFNAPLSWGLEASQHMLLLVFLFGMAEAFRSGAHIRMDLFYRLFPPLWRRVVTLFYAALAIGAFALLINKAVEEAIFLRNINEVSQYLHMPKWLFVSIMILVACLVVLFFAVRAIEVIRGSREEVEDDHNPFLEVE